MRIAALLIAALTGGVASAQYPTPEQAGFHHCVLLYDAEKRDADRMLPHVTHLQPSGTPDQWLFDAFLFLSQNLGPSTGKSYMTQPTNAEDWTALLDSWFAPDRGLHALQQAVDRAKATLGPPPAPLQVIIAIPYPSTAMSEFGDVNGDGVVEDLGDSDDLATALQWYLDRVRTLFAQPDLPDLRLWGYYWMWEAVSGKDAASITLASELIHDRGLKHLWIPWFRAPGYDRWRELGFDVALMQPNYAFISGHEGNVRYHRLLENAALAHAQGLGVEMETDYDPDTNPRAREIFRDYMAFGAPERCGYQQAATAYFQSYRVFENLMQAQDPDARHTYDQLAAYVRGETIPLPGRLEGATCTVDGTPAPRLVDGRMQLSGGDAAEVVLLPAQGAELSIHLAAPRDIGHLELGAIAPENRRWSGSVRVRAFDAQGAVLAAAWRRETFPASERGPGRHVVPVPVEAEAVHGLEVRVLPDGEQVPLSLDEITATVHQRTAVLHHLAEGCPYRSEPEQAATYPDRGGLLTDGLAATAGWTQGRSVGFSGRAEVCVTLDLGRPVAVERCVVHCDGGGYGAANFPERVSLSLGLQGAAEPARSEGRGEPPEPPVASVTATAAQVAVDFEHRTPGSADAMASGHFALVPEKPVRARYAALRFRPLGWLMLSEIEIIAGGENVARGLEYHLTPRPAPAQGVKYPDDGRLLVDGKVASSLEPKRVCGWEDAPTARVTLDLGATRPIGRVTVHALGGGLHGVYAPGRVLVETSQDGRQFAPPAAVAHTDPGDGTCGHVPIVVELPEGAEGRYVRVGLENLRGWTLLSEVEVQP